MTTPHPASPAALDLAALDDELGRVVGVTVDVPDRVEAGDEGGAFAGGDQAARLRALVDRAAATDDPAGGDDSNPWSLSRLERGAANADRASDRTSGPDRPLTIAIASGKGGVGKTSLAVNLAVALSMRRHRVTLLDADLGTANADLLCGVQPSGRLNHVLGEGGLGVHDGARCTLRDIVIPAPGGFGLIPGSAGMSRMADLSAPERRTLLAALEDLDGQTDVLLVDTGAGIGRGVISFVDAADLTLVVCTPEPTSLADAYALLKVAAATEHRLATAHAAEPSPFQVIINQVRDEAEARQVFSRLRAVGARFLGVEVALAGWIAQDVRVSQAVRARQPFMLRSPDSPAATNLSWIADRLAQRLPPPAIGSGRSEPRRTLASALRRVFGLT